MKITTFQTAHGPIAFEVVETERTTVDAASKDGRTAKGGGTFQTSDLDFMAALGSLKAFAGCIDDVLADMPKRPKVFKAEVGLKLSGSTGFVIAKAGGECEVTLSMTWGD